MKQSIKSWLSDKGRLEGRKRQLLELQFVAKEKYPSQVKELDRKIFEINIALKDIDEGIEKSLVTNAFEVKGFVFDKLIGSFE